MTATFAFNLELLTIRCIILNDIVRFGYIVTDIKQHDALRIRDVEELRLETHFLEVLPSLNRGEHHYIQLSELSDHGRTPAHDCMGGQKALHCLGIIVLPSKVVYDTL